MRAKKLFEGLWQIDLGAVNAFVIADGGLTLIDTGVPNSADKIASALTLIGKSARDIQHIVVTHCHPDHTGSLAELKRRSGAPVYMHPADAALVRQGQAKRPMSAAPGLLRGLMFNLFVARSPQNVEPCTVDQEIDDGALLPIAGGLKVVHVPGHCTGQVALLWERQRVLFVADAASNMPTFGLSLGYENLQDGLRSLSRIASLSFDVACFGHGKTILSDASARFRKKWAGTSV